MGDLVQKSQYMNPALKCSRLLLFYRRENSSAKSINNLCYRLYSAFNISLVESLKKA